MTFRKPVISTILACFAAPLLHADFCYEQTTKITGGALVSMMKFVGAFSKDGRKAMEPIKSATAIQGNRMVHRTADSASIIDLDKETITTVNYTKKTYSVATFAQIKQGIDAMSQAMRDQKASANEQNPNSSGQNPNAQNVDMHFDVKVNDTGQSKVINGNNAREMIMTITMQGTDPKSGAKGGLDVTTDMWVAAQVSGYQEVRDFSRRMSEKLEWTPGANPLLMSRPDTARAMAQLYKEGSKLDGMPVYETIKMGGKVEGQNQPSGSQAQSSQSQSAQSQSTQESAPPPASVSQAIGAALGSRFGGFGRHKKQSQQDDSNSTASTSSSNANTSSNGNTSSASGSLIEMTTEVLSYSTTADPSLFEIPSGFSQVENATPQGQPRR